MVDARLRRLCEIKPSGKCHVPDSVHKAWKEGGKARDDLRVLLEKFDLDKDLKDQLRSTHLSFFENGIHHQHALCMFDLR